VRCLLMLAQVWRPPYRAFCRKTLQVGKPHRLRDSDHCFDVQRDYCACKSCHLRFPEPWLSLSSFGALRPLTNKARSRTQPERRPYVYARLG